MTKENVDGVEKNPQNSSASAEDRLCGICMEPRETDELINRG